MKRTILLGMLIISIITAFAQDDNVNLECKAYFKFEVNNQIMTLLPATAINFFNKSEGNVSEWYWDFGDGNKSNEPNPMFVFYHPLNTDSSSIKPNPYKIVSLTIKTVDGCKSYYSEIINIYDGVIINEIPQYSARFKYYLLSFDSIHQKATYQFNNYSEGNNLNYMWQVDDGRISTETEPQFTFDLSSPERKVCLAISNDLGFNDIFCDAVYIKNPGDWDWPKDTLSVNDCFVEFGYSVNYDVNTFAPALALDFYPKYYGDEEKILWDFGDGATSNVFYPTHIYNIELPDSSHSDVVKYRTTCVTITTKNGCESSYCLDIPLNQITDPEEEECHAWFKYYSPDDVITIPEVKPYLFYDVSEGNVIEREWLFEDGSKSNEREVMKTFNIFKATQKVCLTVIAADGCTNTWCETVFISNFIDSTIITDPNEDRKLKLHVSGDYPIWASACIGKAVAQLYSPDGEVKDVKYYWSNGDEGNVAQKLCPTHTYTVTAISPNGDKISRSFIFNSDGSISEVAENWYINEIGTKTTVYYETKDSSYLVEWKLCDGSIYTGNNVPVELLLCGDKQANVTVRDDAGNVIKSETFELSFAVGNKTVSKKQGINIFPNPVVNELYAGYAGENISGVSVVLTDLTGKIHWYQTFAKVYRGDVLRIDTSMLPRGVFSARIVSDGNVLYTGKFIK